MEFPHPADIVKIGIMAFVFVFLVNMALRHAGYAQYTTKGK